MIEQMTDDDPRRNNPDTDYTDFVTYPDTQIRTEIGIQEGAVRWFRVQLEYNAASDPYLNYDWRQVAGFDHHPRTNWGHDITTERLHLDIYRDGRKEDVKRGFPEIALNEAPRFCEQFLRTHADRYIQQFQRWHGFR